MMKVQCKNIERQFLNSDMANCKKEIIELCEKWFYGKAGYKGLRITFSDGKANKNVDITSCRISVIDGKPKFDFDKWQIVARDVTYEDKYEKPKFQDKDETLLNVDGTNDSYFPTLRLDSSDCDKADRMTVVEAFKHFEKVDAE
ncbi:MAG: hypothetical protein LBC73_11155 [Oscillospiraceae bacterium]|nr:hypothetical protein [Oscillospiraceae bacterium]